MSTGHHRLPSTCVAHRDLLTGPVTMQCSILTTYLGWVSRMSARTESGYFASFLSKLLPAMRVVNRQQVRLDDGSEGRSPLAHDPTQRIGAGRCSVGRAGPLAARVLACHQGPLAGATLSSVPLPAQSMQPAHAPRLLALAPAWPSLTTARSLERGWESASRTEAASGATRLPATQPNGELQVQANDPDLLERSPADAELH